MDTKKLNQLKKILSIQSVSGNEGYIQDEIENWLSSVNAKVYRDNIGNLIAENPHADKKKKKVMMIAHCDEIGFMVNHIDSNGYIHVKSIGGPSMRGIAFSRLRFYNRKKEEFIGIICNNSEHFMESSDRKNVPSMESCHYYIGESNGDKVKKKLFLGDYAIFDINPMVFPDKKNICCRALDDKVGLYSACQALYEMILKKSKANVSLLSSVQEEIGGGAITAVGEFKPDIAVVIDMGFSTDIPGIDPVKCGECKLGEGPILSYSSILNRELVYSIEDIAGKNKIPLQHYAEGSHTGTDADKIYKSGNGIKTVLLGVPVRNMHSPNEIANLQDIEQLVKLLKLFGEKHS